MLYEDVLSLFGKRGVVCNVMLCSVFNNLLFIYLKQRREASLAKRDVKVGRRERGGPVSALPSHYLCALWR